MKECCNIGTQYQNCSLCSWTSKNLVEFYEFNNFEITSVNNSNTFQIDSFCLCDYTYNPTSQINSNGAFTIEKHTIIDSFYISDTIKVDLNVLYTELINLAELYDNIGKSFYAIITDNSVNCESGGVPAFQSQTALPSLEEINSNFQSSEIGIWINVIFDSNNAYLSFKTKGVGGNVLEDCNDYSIYCDDLSCVNELLQSNKQGFFKKTIIDEFCSQNELDLIIKVTDNTLGKHGEHMNSGETSTLYEVINSKIVEIRIDPYYSFSSAIFCSMEPEKLGYLKAAETILHESIHAMFARLAFMNDKARTNVKLHHYGHKVINYNNKYNAREGYIYADHDILLEYYFDSIVKDLWTFNDKYLELINYNYLVYSFDSSNGFWPEHLGPIIITGYTESQLFHNFHSKLIDKEDIPCCGE